jgi:hypothetical protein
MTVQAADLWPKIAVVIPTLNEARNLPHVSRRLLVTGVTVAGLIRYRYPLRARPPGAASAGAVPPAGRPAAGPASGGRAAG